MSVMVFCTVQNHSDTDFIATSLNFVLEYFMFVVSTHLLGLIDALNKMQQYCMNGALIFFTWFQAVNKLKAFLKDIFCF